MQDVGEVIGVDAAPGGSEFRGVHVIEELGAHIVAEMLNDQIALIGSCEFPDQAAQARRTG